MLHISQSSLLVTVCTKISFLMQDAVSVGHLTDIQCQHIMHVAVEWVGSETLREVKRSLDYE